LTKTCGGGNTISRRKDGLTGFAQLGNLGLWIYTAISRNHGVTYGNHWHSVDFLRATHGMSGNSVLVGSAGDSMRNLVIPHLLSANSRRPGPARRRRSSLRLAVRVLTLSFRTPDRLKGGNCPP
jgi:hypothetical protein